jgi:Integrase core domain
MAYHIHTNARTTPKIREEIHQSDLPNSVLAEQHSVHVNTIIKWKTRDTFEDKSHCPHNLKTTLTPIQEYIVVELRKLALISLDDLTALTKEFINPKASRSGIARCLKRHQVNNLRLLEKEKYSEDNSKTNNKGTFKTYEPGFIHIDIKNLPKMPDEEKGQYLYVAIDRATRWVYFKTYPTQTNQSSIDFLNEVNNRFPFEIKIILTDNGTQFTDRFTSQQQEPTGNHVFDKTCQELNIEHRLIKPRHPQTNGMVERFNGRISELIKSFYFRTFVDLSIALSDYLDMYNNQIPQKALNYKTPTQVILEWKDKIPLSFKHDSIYNHTKLDIYSLKL